MSCTTRGSDVSDGSAVPGCGTQASHVHEHELGAQGSVLARAPSLVVAGRGEQAVGHRDRSLQGLQVKTGGQGHLLVKPGGVERFEVWTR